MTKTFKYGGDGTIHKNNSVDVEVDKHGKVVAVWFRCMQLPFKQSDVKDSRADAMRSSDKPFNINAIDFIKEKQYE